jgi:hypothetical protein
MSQKTKSKPKPPSRTDVTMRGNVVFFNNAYTHMAWVAVGLVGATCTDDYIGLKQVVGGEMVYTEIRALDEDDAYQTYVTLVDLLKLGQPSTPRD